MLGKQYMSNEQHTVTITRKRGDQAAASRDPEELIGRLSLKTKMELANDPDIQALSQRLAVELPVAPVGSKSRAKVDAR
jgi:hypothetical protein